MFVHFKNNLKNKLMMMKFAKRCKINVIFTFGIFLREIATFVFIFTMYISQIAEMHIKVYKLQVGTAVVFSLLRFFFPNTYV